MPVIVLWCEQSHSHRKPFEDFSKPQGIARCLCLRTLLPAPAKRNRTSSAVKRAAGVGCVDPRSAVASVAIHCIHMPPGMLRSVCGCFVTKRNSSKEERRVVVLALVFVLVLIILFDRVLPVLVVCIIIIIIYISTFSPHFATD